MGSSKSEPLVPFTTELFNDQMDIVRLLSAMKYIDSQALDLKYLCKYFNEHQKALQKYINNIDSINKSYIQLPVAILGIDPLTEVKEIYSQYSQMLQKINSTMINLHQAIIPHQCIVQKQLKEQLANGNKLHTSYQLIVKQYEKAKKSKDKVEAAGFKAKLEVVQIDLQDFVVNHKQSVKSLLSQEDQHIKHANDFIKIQLTALLTQNLQKSDPLSCSIQRQDSTLIPSTATGQRKKAPNI